MANGYAQHTSDITQAVNGLNSLTAQLAPTSGATATALTNLSQTVAILAKNSSQFETLLQSLDNLSSQGRSILETYYPQIVTQLQTLQAVSSQLAQHQADLAGLLAEIPAATTALPSSGAQRLRAALREHHRLRHSGRWVRTARRPSPVHARTAGAGIVISRRLIVNLIVFFVVSFALVAYGVVNLLGNPLDSPTMLTTHFPDASGLYPGFEVELNGVPVGTVTSTALTEHGHEGDDAASTPAPTCPTTSDRRSRSPTTSASRS